MHDDHEIHDIDNLSDSWVGPLDRVREMLVEHDQVFAWMRDAEELETAIAVQVDPDPVLVVQLREAYEHLAAWADEALTQGLAKRLEMVKTFRRTYDARRAERAERLAAMSPTERARYVEMIAKLKAKK